MTDDELMSIARTSLEASDVTPQRTRIAAFLLGYRYCEANKDRVQGSGVTVQGSEVMSQGSEVMSQGSGVTVQGSEVTDTGSNTVDSTVQYDDKEDSSLSDNFVPFFAQAILAPKKRGRRPKASP